MNNSEEKAVYKLNVSFGRMGDLSGLFVAKKNHVKLLLEHKLEVYFGEVLGKHSEIYGEIEESDMSLVSDSIDVIDVVEKHKLETGFNPFEYSITNSEREDFEDLTILEVVEILERESIS